MITTKRIESRIFKGKGGWEASSFRMLKQRINKILMELEPTPLKKS
jgi:hypothetical protein